MEGQKSSSKLATFPFEVKDVFFCANKCPNYPPAKLVHITTMEAAKHKDGTIESPYFWSGTRALASIGTENSETVYLALLAVHL